MNRRPTPLTGLESLAPAIRQASMALIDSSEAARIIQSLEQDHDDEIHMSRFDFGSEYHNDSQIDPYWQSATPTPSRIAPLQPSQVSQVQSMQFSSSPIPVSPAASQESVSSGLPNWNSDSLLVLMKAVVGHNPNLAPTMKERGSQWVKARKEFNTIALQKGFAERTTDAMKIKFNELRKKREEQVAANTRASGIVENTTEIDQLLDEYIESQEHSIHVRPGRRQKSTAAAAAAAAAARIESTRSGESMRQRPPPYRWTSLMDSLMQAHARSIEVVLSELEFIETEAHRNLSIMLPCQPEWSRCGEIFSYHRKDEFPSIAPRSPRWLVSSCIRRKPNMTASWELASGAG
ncbi:uncharacterized protein SPSC_01932 [Sporisorium scitamineum]|uniref:Uncharacterized protein n=1 Tax=Sporisorium scitamineum TaxID=49012 RepID=A0A127ZCV9_9BASI|nr:uncharacterized protein SPSC_01932 [Sporisorium scitamineum]